jgi:hypothetical protein
MFRRFIATFFSFFFGDLGDFFRLSVGSIERAFLFLSP